MNRRSIKKWNTTNCVQDGSQDVCQHRIKTDILRWPFHIFQVETIRKWVPGIASGRLWHICTISILTQNKFKSSGNAQLSWGKKKCHSAGKFGASVFWNAGIIHKEFMPQGTITEMNTYHDMLRCPHHPIHRKRFGHLSRDVTLDNALPHSTQAE